MDRDLGKLEQWQFDLVVIGGGISGLCVAYEAVNRGLSVAVVDKGDFGAATSSATSKLIHGGLRYLKQLDFSVVRESLRERRVMMQIAPHLVYPYPFLIPTYKKGNTKLLLRMGLFLYDLLSFDRNKIPYPSKKMPKHRLLGVEEVLEREPGVNREGLTGGLLYYDAQMPDPNRLTWSFALSAAEKGVLVYNYVAAQDFIVDTKAERRRVEALRVQDSLTGKEYTVKAKVFVNAAGPWADEVMSMSHDQSHKNILRSKGIHIITRQLVRNYALTLRTPKDRHIFIIPWRGYSLIGTTDVEYRKDPDSLKVTERDVKEFIADVNASYAEARLTREDVLHAYAGLRPLVEKDTEVSSYKASRKYEVYDHSVDNLNALVTVIGGKYTTSRQLGKDVVDKIATYFSHVRPQSRTDEFPLAGGDTGEIEDYVQEELKHNHYGLSNEVLEYQIRNYGTRYKEVLGPGEADKKMFNLIVPEQKEIWAQVDYAVNKEMARRLTDVVFRRTGLATTRDPGRDVIEKVATYMGQKLHWDKKRLQQEVNNYYDEIAIDDGE